jgi:hypothetical protein
MDDLPVLTIGCSKSMSRAWWSGSIKTFLYQNATAILDRLAFRAIETHSTNHDAQLRAWRLEIDILRNALADISGDWQILLEYPLIRLGRIIDAVLVTDRAIFVIEFKALNSRITNDARVQVEDYAFDLRDFHAGSRNHVIVPILVAGNGEPGRPQWSFPWPGVSVVYDALPATLPELLREILARIHHRDVDVENWERAAYRPVPTIIEAERALYAKHGVADIKTARADTGNLSRTTEAILQAVQEAKEKLEHIILFVTGTGCRENTLRIGRNFFK